MSEIIVRLKREHKIDKPGLSGDWILLKQCVETAEDGLQYIECFLQDAEDEDVFARMPSDWLRVVNE